VTCKKGMKVIIEMKKRVANMHVFNPLRVYSLFKQLYVPISNL